MFLDPVRCWRCLLESRVRLGLEQGVVERIASRAGGRTEAFVETYRVLVEAVGGDPLRAEKERLNRAVLEKVGEVWGLVSRGLLEGLMVAAAANSVDVWMPWYHDGLRDPTASLGDDVVFLADPRAVEGLLRSAGSIAILLDNAGEAVVDTAYAVWLAAQGKRVYLVARSMPYETDVTAQEAERLLHAVAGELGLGEPRVTVLGTGSYYPAPARPHIDPKLLRVLDTVDAIVSKGIANYEAFTEYNYPSPEKTIIALRAKCPVVAEHLGVPQGKAVIGLPGRKGGSKGADAGSVG